MGRSFEGILSCMFWAFAVSNYMLLMPAPEKSLCNSGVTFGTFVVAPEMNSTCDELLHKTSSSFLAPLETIGM